MIKQTAAAALLTLGLATGAQALEFQPLGAGSLGVGGAGVARTYGAMAPYWNPAGLAFAPKTMSISLSTGIGVQPKGNLARDLDDFSTNHDAWNSDKTNVTKANALIDSANELIGTTPDDHLRVTAQAGVGVQIKHAGFGVFGTFEGGAIPNAGGNSIAHVTPATVLGFSDDTITDALAGTNPKTITIRGIALVEVPISYGYAFNLGPAGKLALGGSSKYLYGEVTSKTRQQVWDAASKSVVSSSDLTHDLSKNRKGSSSWGVDLGLLWQPSKSIALGMVGKNLNSPKFDSAEDGKVTVDRQVRAGVSLTPFSWLELTGDIDVLKNPTVVPGVKSQQLGGGMELHPFSSLKLRVGGYTDLAATTSGAVTAGLSLGIPWLYFDLDGAYGLGKVKYKGSDYPTEAKVQFSTNIAF